MNKQQFLVILESKLKQLGKNEREEIIEFYNERITNSTTKDTTEEEVIDNLESIDTIVKNTLQEYEITKQDKTPIDQGTTNKALGIFGIVWFDILVTSWAVPALFAVAVTLVVCAPAGVILSFTAFITTYNFLLRIVLFVGSVAISVLLAVAALYVTQAFIYTIEYVANIHYNVFTGTKGRTFKFKNIIEDKKILIKKGSIYSSITFGIMALITLFSLGYLIDNYFIKPSETGEFIEVLDSSSSWSLDIDADNTEILYHDGDDIILEYSYHEKNAPTININNNTNTVSLEYGKVSSIANFSIYQSIGNTSLTIHIPESIEIDTIKIEVYNGNLIIDNSETKYYSDINLRTYNGNINVNNVEAQNDLVLRSYNGHVNATNVSSDYISLYTYNGNIKLEDSSFNTAKVQTYNGRINISDITAITDTASKLEVISYNGTLNLNDVYIQNVYLKTYNGDITYINTDRVYLVHFISPPYTYNGTFYPELNYTNN